MDVALEKAKRKKKEKKEMGDTERLLGEFPLWLSGLRTQLVSMRMQVPSLASLSGLRIWHCRELWCRLQMWLLSLVAVAVT